MASARVGVGVHFPHDVVTGLMLGSVVVGLAVLLLHPLARAAVPALR